MVKLTTNLEFYLNKENHIRKYIIARGKVKDLKPIFQKIPYKIPNLTFFDNTYVLIKNIQIDFRWNYFK